MSNNKIPCEIYTRTVGYFRPVANWNLGKKEEFRLRKTLKIPNMKEIENECTRNSKNI